MVAAFRWQKLASCAICIVAVFSVTDVAAGGAKFDSLENYEIPKDLTGERKRAEAKKQRDRLRANLPHRLWMHLPDDEEEIPPGIAKQINKYLALSPRKRGLVDALYHS
ncbi:acyl- N-acyltransferase, putative [Babesia ovis]|uniref:Acyl- N-acyltransferase, putative n=1 Tax=Babesia ovis TaxID=5869 RepID=A0A9W5WTX2_BABOV|nr:acyl- N-acyltransferase, putative [Babesia ovis]